MFLQHTTVDHTLYI